MYTKMWTIFLFIGAAKAVCTEELFRSDGPIVAASSNTIGTVDIRDSMHFEMDFEIHSLPTENGWRCPFKVVSPSGAGAGIPIFFLDGPEEMMVLIVHDLGLVNKRLIDTKLMDVEAGGQYHVELDWFQDHFVATVNGEVKIDKAVDGHLVDEDRAIQVGAGTPGDVTVSNILICELGEETTAEPMTTETTTAEPTMIEPSTSASAHQVAQGRTSWGGWGSAAVSYCQSDTNNQAAYPSSKHSYNIGVGCCSIDGTKGYRPDCSAHPATYDEAVAVCSSRGYRLCTLQEMLSGKSNGKGITEGTGCWYDAAYQWTSDECGVGTDEPTTSSTTTSSTTTSSTTTSSTTTAPSTSDDGMIHDEDGYVLIERHIDVVNGYFSSDGAKTGIENEDDPEANTYSIIGALDASEYLLDGGYYEFKLIYEYRPERYDITEDVLEWTQTSWLTESSVTGADLSKIDDENAGDAKKGFHGLSKSSNGYTYLDGDSGAGGAWRHAVVTTELSYRSDDIPAHEGRFAYAQSLWIRTVSAPDAALSFDDIVISSSPMSWTKATEWCGEQGLELVSIHSESDNDAVYEACKASPGSFAWIGLNVIGDSHSVDNFVWSDGSAVDFTNWGGNQPDNQNANNDCVRTYCGGGGGQGVWLDDPCGWGEPYALCAPLSQSLSDIAEKHGASDVSVLQSGEAQTVSAEQSVAESAGSESSFSLQIVIGVAAFGMGAISVLALLALKKRVQQKAAMKPAQEEHVPEVSVSAVPETTITEMEVAIEMEAKQETV